MLTWGNISVYITSYLRLYDPTIGHEDTFMVFPLVLIVMYLSMQLGAIANIYLPTKVIMTASALLLLTGLLAASYVTSFFWFEVLFVVFYGFSNGLSYFTPFVAAWSYLP
jgi:hypothetical protein